MLFLNFLQLNMFLFSLEIDWTIVYSLCKRKCHKLGNVYFWHMEGLDSNKHMLMIIYQIYYVDHQSHFWYWVQFPWHFWLLGITISQSTLTFHNYSRNWYISCTCKHFLENFSYHYIKLIVLTLACHFAALSLRNSTKAWLEQSDAC